MKTLGDFSPYIERLGLDEAYLDVTGCEEHYGSIQTLLSETDNGRLYSSHFCYVANLELYMLTK